MMVKSGLEKNILKFHVPLQRHLLTSQANSAFLGRFFLHWTAATLKGLMEFQNNPLILAVLGGPNILGRKWQPTTNLEAALSVHILSPCIHSRWLQPPFRLPTSFVDGPRRHSGAVVSRMVDKEKGNEVEKEGTTTSTGTRICCHFAQWSIRKQKWLQKLLNNWH